MEYKVPVRYIPIIYLLYSWGSLFGVPSRVPLRERGCSREGGNGIAVVAAGHAAGHLLFRVTHLECQRDFVIMEKKRRCKLLWGRGFRV